MLKFISSLLLLLMFTHCQAQTTADDFKKLEWLLGNWRGQANGANFYESWERVNDREWSNVNYSLCNGRQVIGEHGALRVVDGKIVMGGGKAQWRAMRITEHEIVLENPDIAYAQKITHRLTPAGQWHARIEQQNGVLEYTLTKVAPLAALTKQQPPYLSGRFSGQVTTPGKTAQMIADFSVQDGQPRLLVSAPENQAQEIPARRLCYDQSDGTTQLKFALPDGAQEIEFVAEIRGDEIIGKVTKGNLPVTLRLRRAPAVQPIAHAHAGGRCRAGRRTRSRAPLSGD
jgi:hypothetical protein